MTDGCVQSGDQPTCSWEYHYFKWQSRSDEWRIRKETNFGVLYMIYEDPQIVNTKHLKVGHYVVGVDDNQWIECVSNQIFAVSSCSLWEEPYFHWWNTTRLGYGKAMINKLLAKTGCDLGSGTQSGDLHGMEHSFRYTTYMTYHISSRVAAAMSSGSPSASKFRFQQRTISLVCACDHGFIHHKGMCLAP